MRPRIPWPIALSQSRIVQWVFRLPPIILQLISLTMLVLVHVSLIDRGSLLFEAVTGSERVCIVESIIAYVLIVFFIIIYFMSIFLLLMHAASVLWELVGRDSTLYGVALLYIEFIVFFATVYYIVLFFTDGQAISGISSVKYAYDPKHVAIYHKWAALRDISLQLLDCFHFSVVTQTTLGYGDVLPKTFVSKLIVDAQVILGLYLIVIAIARKLAER